jgi:hypothetical protein
LATLNCIAAISPQFGAEICNIIVKLINSNKSDVSDDAAGTWLLCFNLLPTCKEKLSVFQALLEFTRDDLFQHEHIIRMLRKIPQIREIIPDKVQAKIIKQKMTQLHNLNKVFLFNIMTTSSLLSATRSQEFFDMVITYIENKKFTCDMSDLVRHTPKHLIPWYLPFVSLNSWELGKNFCFFQILQQTNKVWSCTLIMLTFFSNFPLDQFRKF